ncbi:MAG: secondary thiamine-phosphate synthase enzyme YjbQ, partial [marine benthic group bacterium]|nr:secondary thiamine-phosphate synthase enzyme YjbQ [Gemmatimonadota bacterium]
HTSASLTINENADPTVRHDFESHFERAVPEDAPYYRHTAEGPDDMPAHIKASLMGSSVTIPISGGRLALGTWQGIYLCEHRDRGGRRSLVATVMGD